MHRQFPVIYLGQSCCILFIESIEVALVVRNRHDFSHLAETTSTVGTSSLGALEGIPDGRDVGVGVGAADTVGFCVGTDVGGGAVN